MRKVALVVLLLIAVASAADTSEIHVYRRGKVLGYDKDVGESLNEALIETWSCETGELVKTERVETYFHLSDDGEVLTPRALCDRCRERFELEKKGAKWLFHGKKKPPEKKPETGRIEPAKPAVAPVATPAKAQIDGDALSELESKASDAASEIKRVDPREVGSATKRRRIIEDRGLQVAFSEWRDDAQAARAVSKKIEGRIDLSGADRYYVLRSFGWQRYHERDDQAAAVFYERCIAIEPSWSSAHYGLALVKRDLKDNEGELAELAWSLRVKPKAKYAKLLLERLNGMKAPVGRFDAAACAEIKKGAEDAKANLEKEPPDPKAAKEAIEATIGKVLDAKAPLGKKGASSTPEPDDER